MKMADKIKRILTETVIFLRQEIRFCWRDRKLFLVEVGLAVFVFLILVTVFVLSDNPFMSTASASDRPINICVDHDCEGPLLRAVVERLPKIAGAHLVEAKNSPLSELNPEEIDVVIKQQGENSILCLLTDSVQSVTLRQRIRSMLEQCRIQYLRDSANSGLFPRSTLTVFKVEAIHAKNSSGAEDYGFLTLICFWIMRSLTVAVNGLAHSINLTKKGHNMEPLLSAPVNRLAIVLGRILAALPVGIVGGCFWLLGGLGGLITACIYLCFRPKTMHLLKQGVSGGMNSSLHLPGGETIFYFILVLLLALLVSSCLANFVALKINPDKPHILERLFVNAVIPVVPYFALAPGIELNWPNAFIPLVNLYLLIKASVMGGSPDQFLPVILTETLLVVLVLLWLGQRELHVET